MKKTSTKATAEAVLRELPSVLGASVREDVFGHPREVHLLISPGPDPKHLARDVRELLQERLGVPIDQRVISIAQVADQPARPVPEATVPGEVVQHRGSADDRSGDPRLIYRGIESVAKEGRVEVRIRLSWRDQEFTGTGIEVDGGQGRIRAAAAATLRAATLACDEKIRFDLEAATLTRAFGADYVLITAIAASPLIGRRPISLVGAQPVEIDAETAATFATLQAINRVVAFGLTQ